jgi:hypothetical protein
MADQAVTVTELVLDTASADLLTTAEGSVEITAANVAVITNVSPSHRLLIFAYENGGGAASLSVAAGDRPAAMQADAALTVAVPSGDAVVFALEASKYIQDNDTIRITVSDQNTHVAAVRIPLGA